MGYVNAHAPHRPEQQAQPAFTVPVVFGPARQAQFAYRVITREQEREGRLDEAELNVLGKQGWLLVSALPRSTAEGRSRLEYVFVRMEP